jgi:hypothetical protein
MVPILAPLPDNCKYELRLESFINLPPAGQDLFTNIPEKRAKKTRI